MFSTYQNLRMELTTKAESVFNLERAIKVAQEDHKGLTGAAARCYSGVTIPIPEQYSKLDGVAAQLDAQEIMIRNYLGHTIIRDLVDTASPNG